MTNDEIRAQFELVVGVIRDTQGKALSLERGEDGYVDANAQLAWAWFSLGFDRAKAIYEK